ncbi:hypothetical protein DUNSADRAFT_15127 [Dunaliella salina]|uniref:Uncharacterized protein n=1 Tax=Dunaliella salina TaxID=3046 RepID=A0ABQ7H251_DUNSA|nr:hypothetical protein DUNSADRAFT_15127 [Dunaliella salina]|eukprot:KAF5840926.1 hypothetical protein DUNSADRAFT_15127 [Dunaliella salina]
MAASAVFLAVQTPVGALLAALGRASKRLAASCSALASRFSKETHKGMGAAIVQECSMEGGSSKTEGQDSRETGLDSSKTGLDSSESEGLGSSSSSSSSSGGGGGGSGGSNAGSGVVAAGSVVGSKMAAAPIGGGMLHALESTAAVEAQDGAVHLDAQPHVPATLLRTAACLGLVALSTYIAASETSVPLMTGEWATQPVTFLFVAAIVVGDLALPAAVAAAAVATAVVGIWQSFWSSRGSSSRETSGLISDNVDDITTHRSSGDGSKGPGSSSSSSSNHSSSSSSNHSSMGTGRDGRNVGVDRESEQSSSSPSRPGSMRSMGRAGSSIPPPPLQNDASQPGKPSAVCTLRRPTWLSQLLLAIYAIRAVLDVALTVAVAMGWLSGHLSAVRIVALLLLLRICWSERPAPSRKL